MNSNKIASKADAINQASAFNFIKKPNRMSALKTISISNYKIENTGQILDISLSYQTFGVALGKAPIILVNHALTGNSNVSGKTGWWNSLIGQDKCIDTETYSILAFNVPTASFKKAELETNFSYKDITAKDTAKIFGLGLNQLNIKKLFAVIGGSVGGGIAWEMAALYPTLIDHLIPVATDWKSTDWVIANCHIQDLILNNSKSPLHDARQHAMTLYRTPESFTSKFSRSKKKTSLFNVESWLNHHGKKLESRFQIYTYKVMNQILKTIDITASGQNFVETASAIQSQIHIVTINSDLLFKSEENWNTFVDLKSVKDDVFIHEIKSIHGHDAFLIEYQQLQRFLKPIFKPAHNSKLKRTAKPQVKAA